MSALDLREFSCSLFKYKNNRLFVITRTVGGETIAFYTVVTKPCSVTYEDIGSGVVLTPDLYPETISALDEVIRDASRIEKDLVNAALGGTPC